MPWSITWRHSHQTVQRYLTTLRIGAQNLNIGVVQKFRNAAAACCLQMVLLLLLQLQLQSYLLYPPPLDFY
jgi:hypothetical protein